MNRPSLGRVGRPLILWLETLIALRDDPLVALLGLDDRVRLSYLDTDFKGGFTDWENQGGFMEGVKGRLSSV